MFNALLQLLEFLTFAQETLPVHFTLGPENYVAGPVPMDHTLKNMQ